jgi:Mlc titration factor MtfA (ptsG expression regulator)
MRWRRHPKAEIPPDLWRWVLPRSGAVWDDLGPERRRRLEELTGSFLATKEFETAGDMAVDDTMRATIAAHACLLALDLGLDVYRDVHSVIVYPTAVVKTGAHADPSLPGAHRSCPTPLAGEAMLHGPVVITWDAVRAGVAHPEHGRNVVYHEFAHKIDMRSGEADGIPPVGTRADMVHWEGLIDDTLAAVRAGSAPDPALGSYAEVNAAELFAVATETLFTIPDVLRRHHPELYRMLHGFYRPEPSSS